MATNIYLGPWINWGHGGLIMGATLTLSDRNGSLLITFIATFVTLTAAQLWKILTFAIHQIRSTTTPQDGLFHQQQAVWRNASGPGGVAWTSLQQLWFWRGKAKHSFFRTLSWAMFAILYLIVFAVLAVFSSVISKSPGPQRLLVANEDICGYWALNYSSPDYLRALASIQTNTSSVAAAYARACYTNNSASLQCSRYPVSKISWDVNKNATCPFESGICGYGDTAAYQMTSRLIDSQADLGINTRDSQRVQFQKRTTCAPIREANYYEDVNEVYNDTDGTTLLNETYFRLFFGPILSREKGFMLNWTEQASTHGWLDSMGYQVSSVVAFANNTNGTNGWNPIPELWRSNADVSLVFLRQNSLRYKYPSYDGWMSATLNQTNIYDSTDTWWISYLDITTLGCTEESRFCNPSNGRCTDFLGLDQAMWSILNQTLPASAIGLDDMQKEIILRLRNTLRFSDIPAITNSLGAAALRAQETVSGLDQVGDIQVDQWHKEVSYWFAVTLASLQDQTISYVTGPGNLVSGSKKLQPWRDAPGDNYARQLCHNQIINDAGATTSFSILGMTILFAVGGLIIITSLLIERIIAFLQVKFKFNLHGQRAWMLDDKLQMQRIVFENAGGMGKWSTDDLGAISVTTDKSKFPRFPPHQLYNPNNPDGPVDSGHLDPTTEHIGVRYSDGKSHELLVHERRNSRRSSLK